jgi:hypothetical protein
MPDGRNAPGGVACRPKHFLWSDTWASRFLRIRRADLNGQHVPTSRSALRFTGDSHRPHARHCTRRCAKRYGVRPRSCRFWNWKLASGWTAASKLAKGRAAARYRTPKRVAHSHGPRVARTLVCMLRPRGPGLHRSGDERRSGARVADININVGATHRRPTNQEARQGSICRPFAGLRASSGGRRYDCMLTFRPAPGRLKRSPRLA